MRGEDERKESRPILIVAACALIDARGLVLLTRRPEGKHLGTIELPEQPANVTFGGPDRKTLYVTARTSLYTVPTSATGHVFAR